tara:strand:- start:535 stop:666 length:132 start_codon:yes stop_codon:yes gene_type:complete
MTNYSIGESTKEQNTIQGKVNQEYINSLLSNNTKLITLYSGGT